MPKNTLKKIIKQGQALPAFLFNIFSLFLISALFFTGCSTAIADVTGSKTEDTIYENAQSGIKVNESPAEETADIKENHAENSESTAAEQNAKPGDESVLQDKPTAVADSPEIQESSSQITLQPPGLELEIIEGPQYAQDNNICFYRIRANAWGQPYPQIIFNRDDSNGCWGENIAQVNLLKDETFTLICDVSNSQGSAGSSINVAWKDYSVQATNDSEQKQQQAAEQSANDNPANYLIDVNLANQKVNVFYLENLIKSMPCSGGKPETPTPLGTFKTNQKIYYAYVPKFAQGAYYWTRFYGSYLFHSVPYDENKNLLTEELAKIGTPASHGCIRLYLEDAKWMYETIPLGTEVQIHL
ncbi:MAG: L,D-transpeptidase [Actinobacteria bacterium]|nr:L,D-transpeptidase [Actinomycetota bacterium]